MEKLFFEEMIEFVMAVNEAPHDNYRIIGKYEHIKEVLVELLRVNEWLNISSVNIDTPESNGYENEYVMSVANGKVWVEPAIRDGKYFTLDYVDTQAVYILQGCSEEVKEHLVCDLVFECLFDCDGDCENCDCHDDDTDDKYYSHHHSWKDADGIEHFMTLNTNDPKFFKELFG